jgi:hypothetical protein
MTSSDNVMASQAHPERRNGPKDRRRTAKERRNEDRSEEELEPRRTTDQPDRRED